MVTHSINHRRGVKEPRPKGDEDMAADYEQIEMEPMMYQVADLVRGETTYSETLRTMGNARAWIEKNAKGEWDIIAFYPKIRTDSEGGIARITYKSLIVESYVKGQGIVRREAQ